MAREKIKLREKTVREKFAKVIKFVQRGGRVIVTGPGGELVAIVPVNELEFLERIENESDVREARAALEDAKVHGTIPWEQVIKAESGH